MEGSRESQGDRLMPATSISRRRFLATAAAIPAALRPRPARGATPVKIGTAVLGDCSMAGPVLVARERGLVAREGLAAEFVPFRAGPALLKAAIAVRAGKETAAYVWGDGGAVTELQGKSKVLLRFDAVTGKWISQIQYASEDAIKTQADLIRRAMRAMFTALKLMRENPREAAEICSRTLGWPPEAVLGAHKISGPLLPVDGRIDVTALAVMQGTLLEYGVIKKKLPLEEHFTREFTPVKI